MNELDRQLRALAGQIDFPATPELASRVARDLPSRPQRTWRRHLAVAAAVAVIGIGAALAVPQARTAILRFLGVGAVKIEFVDRLPEVRPGTPLDLGTAITPKRAPFPLLRSTLLGSPDGLYREGTVVTLLYGTPKRIHLLVTEILGSGFSSGVGKKLAAVGTRVRFVSIKGAVGPGVWIEGRPHLVTFPGGPPRLAANTLIWQHGQITVRLEGATGLGQAASIAASLH